MSKNPHNAAWTSVIAYASIPADRLKNQRDKVAALMAYGAKRGNGITDREMAAILGINPSTVSARRNEILKWQAMRLPYLLNQTPHEVQQSAPRLSNCPGASNTINLAWMLVEIPQQGSLFLEATAPDQV